MVSFLKKYVTFRRFMFVVLWCTLMDVSSILTGFPLGALVGGFVAFIAVTVGLLHLVLIGPVP